MQPVQLFLFADGTEAVRAEAPRDTTIALPLRLHSDNILVQELMDAGAWSDIGLLEDARANYQREVLECRFVQDSFIAHESKDALKQVAQRLKSLSAG